MESTTWKISSGFKNCYLWVHLFFFPSKSLGLSLPESPWEGGWCDQEPGGADPPYLPGPLGPLWYSCCWGGLFRWPHAVSPHVQLSAECRSSSWDILGAEGEILPGTWGW